MGFYLRCRRLQSGAAAQADSGGLLMAKISGFAKAFAGRAAHCRNGHQATLANTAEFFNSLLAVLLIAIQVRALQWATHSRSWLRPTSCQSRHALRKFTNWAGL